MDNGLWCQEDAVCALNLCLCFGRKRAAIGSRGIGARAPAGIGSCLSSDLVNEPCLIIEKLIGGKRWMLEGRGKTFDLLETVKLVVLLLTLIASNLVF